MTRPEVTLRPINAADTPQIVRWRNLPAVRDNFVWRGEMTPEIHTAWLHDKVDRGLVAQFIILAGPERVPVGSVYLRDIDAGRGTAEFGIFIGEAAWQGRGVGARAAQLVLGHGFHVLGLGLVFLRVFRHNMAAIRSYEKAGFRPLEQPPAFLTAPQEEALLFMQVGREDFLREEAADAALL